MSLGRSTSHSGIKTSRPTELKVIGTGSKSFLSVSLVVIEEAFRFLFLDHGYERNHTRYWKLTKANTTFWRTLPQPSMMLPHHRHCNSLQKVILSFCQASCFRTMGNVVRSVDSMVFGPLPCFFDCGVLFSELILCGIP